MIPAHIQTLQSVSSIPPISVASVDLSQPSNCISPKSPCFASHPPPITTTKTVPTSTFEENLSQAALPPPGPSHYAARRALWLAPTNSPPPPPAPSTSRDRLEQLLSLPGAVDNDEVWKAGIEKVWKGLVAGGRLKRRLPMNLVIKIIHAGWIRDPETWPAGAIAPEPDDILDGPSMFQPISRMPTEYSSGVTTSWAAVSPTTAGGDAENGVDRQAYGMVGIEGGS